MPVVQSQSAHHGARNQTRLLRGLQLHLGGIGNHAHFHRHVAHFELEINRDLGIHIQLNSGAGCFLEAPQLGAHRIGPRRQQRRNVQPGFIGSESPAGAAAGVGDSNGGVNHRRTRAVRHLAHNICRDFLGPKRRTGKRENRDREAQTGGQLTSVTRERQFKQETNSFLQS